MLVCRHRNGRTVDVPVRGTLLGPTHIVSRVHTKMITYLIPIKEFELDYNTSNLHNQNKKFELLHHPSSGIRIYIYYKNYIFDNLKIIFLFYKKFLVIKIF